MTTDDNAPVTKAELKAELAPIKLDIADLKHAVKANTLDIIQIKTDIAEIKETMATKADVNRVFNLLDSIAGEIKTYRREDTLRGDAVMRHDEKISNHETRITLLESKK